VSMARAGNSLRPSSRLAETGEPGMGAPYYTKVI